ncbi:hypothetical protein [Salinispora vitiensis]|uniref:hypothetical protein n=1 Tax=Salinispora vitiensis TaxID=999544 RepID=UPI00037DA2F2|nr:hypothetical protein [Salinispora vitiensis]
MTAVPNPYPDPPQHPTTFADAQKVSPLDLARRVGDVLRWLGDTISLPTDVPPGDPRRVQRLGLELEHLATVRALHHYLGRSTAHRVHAAVISGATAEQVTLATGLSLTEVTAIWTTWSDGQRKLERDLPHLPQHTAAYDYVADVLAAGCTTKAASDAPEDGGAQREHDDLNRTVDTPSQQKSTASHRRPSRS